MLRNKIKKLNDSFTALCIGVKCKIEGLKNDEDAMEVIQVVMIIAVGVIAIAAVWAGVNGLLKTWWEKITGVDTGSQETFKLPS